MEYNQKLMQKYKFMMINVKNIKNIMIIIQGVLNVIYGVHLWLYLMMVIMKHQNNNFQNGLVKKEED